MGSPDTAIDFPVCLRLRGKRVLLIGAGNIAEGRALQLLEAGARLRVIAPGRQRRCGGSPRRAGWSCWSGPYAVGDVAGQALVFVATDDRRVSEAVAEEARALGIWLNAADEPTCATSRCPRWAAVAPSPWRSPRPDRPPRWRESLRRRLVD